MMISALLLSNLVFAVYADHHHLWMKEISPEIKEAIDSYKTIHHIAREERAAEDESDEHVRHCRCAFRCIVQKLKLMDDEGINEERLKEVFGNIEIPADIKDFIKNAMMECAQEGTS
ncbi:hypothetical protein KM043_018470 [Ampulex compressa]|nr:hypothetical protein KM043_018470 [Ampulex compressa]